MLKLIDLISREVSGAFSAAGYDEAYGRSPYPTARICANTSATARCPPRRFTINLPWPLQRTWLHSLQEM